jgi:hypothetical protein
MLQDSCSRWEYHVGRRGGTNDQIHIGCGFTRSLQCAHAGGQRQIAGRLIGGGEVAIFDPRALDDPFIGCFDTILR